MSNKVGVCYQCGESLGSRTVNGKFVSDPKKFRQIVLVYTNSDKETYIHVPVCSVCAKNVNSDKVINGIQDRHIKDFIASGAKFIRSEVEYGEL